MKITISGGTGFIGGALVEALKLGGHVPTVLTRSVERASKKDPDTRFVSWDDVDALRGADAVVNLAGENLVGRRWTHSVKKEIIESRVEVTSSLARGMAALAENERPSVFVSASAVGYYGDGGDTALTETSPSGTDFLAYVCRRWEEEAQNAPAGVRVVNPRFGIVLHPEGGALKQMLTPFKFFVGGALGSGRQYFPWVHREDLVRIILECISNAELQGPVNAVAPAADTMSEFAKALGDAINRPSLFRVPEFALRLVMGEAADALVASQKVVPKALQRVGFRWKYSDLKTALHDLFPSD